MSSKTSSRITSSSSSSSGAAKLVDESHMKTLRELVQLQGNRHCFECSQRGPTYVDVTIGSFICMTCSGLLRGITPPHRVKSISMATFTPDEIQFLRTRGNEYCRKVWLATYTSRDSNLASSTTTETDSDKRNTLKSHMSAKYEQKRYYLDPSKIPDLHNNDVPPASSFSLSGGSSSGSGSSVSNRSPSLSSASSGSSLSQGVHTSANGNNNAPSPIMNNLRNNASLISTSGLGGHHHNGEAGGGGGIPSSRLVNSQTLPDIKPLSSLLPLQPINFINNLSNPVVQQHDDKIINTNHQLQNGSSNKDPWAVGDGGAATNGFNANFANFDEAFSSPGNGAVSSPNFDPFSNSSNRSNNHHSISRNKPSNIMLNGGGGGDNSINFGGFATFDKPLLPISHQNQNGGNLNNDLNNGHYGQNGTGGGSAGDRYAALKDLDEIFKQGSDSGEIAKNTTPQTNGTSNNTHHTGLSNSTSMPANLSSSGGNNGWSSLVSPGHNQQPNPFSMFGTSPNSAGWGAGSAPPPTMNPFAAVVGASSSPATSSWSGPPSQGHQGNFLFSGHSQHQFGPSSSSQMFNPFATTATTAPSSNPHNPFL